MSLKRSFFLVVVVWLMVGCAGQVYDRAYTASGDGAEEKDLRPDSQFNTTDDFNVVVKLNKHDETIQIEARFLDTNKDVVETVSAAADSDVETVILGVDYEARADQVNQWVEGNYTVQIMIDGEQIDTLSFRVD